MSDAQLYLLEVDKNKAEAQSIALRSAERLKSKQLKLIDLITSVDNYINNKEDARIRAKSVAYLADVLSAVPPKVLSGQERRLLIDFILGRLEGDLEGIGASARSLIALETLGSWDGETAQRILRTFVRFTHPLRQFKLHTDRHAIVQLIDLLVAKYRKPIEHIHNGDRKFMTDFISYFEGEKDPRNLMIIFSFLLVPMTEWDIRAHAQEMFEAVFNYFPITFKPPPDDPYGITAQDLKDRLRACIAANSDFAPYAFPQLLDKLDSTSLNTKRDVLQTIQSTVARYTEKTIMLYAVTIWDALKFEILGVQEEDLVQEALKALALISAKLSSAEGPLNSYLQPVIKECNEHFEDAPTRQSQAASRILHELAKASPHAANTIAKGILPTLFALFGGSESISKRRGLLEGFNEIVRAYVSLQTDDPDFDTSTLQTFGSTASDVMLSALLSAPKAEVSFRLASLNGLVLLISLRKVLSTRDTERAVSAVSEIILNEEIEDHRSIREQAIKALTEMARHCPDIVRNQAVPAFMAALPDLPSSETKYTPALEAFVKLSVEQQIFDTIVLRLKNKQAAAEFQNAPTEYLRALQLAMLYAFTFGSPMPQENGILRSEYYANYAEPLIATLRANYAIKPDSVKLETVGRMCNITLRPQTADFQDEIYSKNLEWLMSFRRSDSSGFSSLTPFILYYHAALRPEVVDAVDILATLGTQAAAVLHTPSDQEPDPLVLRHLSLLINKFLDPGTMESTLRSCDVWIQDLFSAPFSSSAIHVAFAITKALVIRGKAASLTSKYLSTLLETLSHNDTTTARLFTTLLAPDDLLTVENHCIVSKLYKQKTFAQAVPHITSSLRTAEPHSKPNYLVALAGILRWLPYSILEPSLPTLVAPLLQTLDLATTPSHQPVKASALSLFESVLMHDSELVAEHTASLITRLLNCTAAPANNAKVREKALQCLSLVPRQLKREAVMPYRRQVVKRLMACLDDGRRDVRAEAVRCRTAWLGLEDGDEEDE